MVVEDILQGTEHAGSEIAAVAEMAECWAGAADEIVFATAVGVVAGAVNVAGADTAMVEVHYVPAFVEEGHIEGVDSAIVTEVVQVHNEHVIAEVRAGSQVGFEAGLEILS